VYCINNESGERIEWSDYWAGYLHEAAKKAGVKAHVTEMRRNEDVRLQIIIKKQLYNMTKKFVFLLTFFVTFSFLYASDDNHVWQAIWINSQHQQNKSNSWTIFHKKIDLKEDISKAIINMAVDSKYWL
jgi:hypothetical protein